MKRRITSKEEKQLATVHQTIQFALDCGGRIQLLLVAGFIAAVLNGLVYPAIAYVFSQIFTDLTVASTNGGLSHIRELAFQFMIIGVIALLVGLIQTWCFEVVAYHATKRFRLEWFKALLRQDPAFFDVYDVSGIAGQVGPSANKYRRGVGRKLGEGIQFLTTGLGGLVFAFYASWRIALVVLSIVPFVAGSALAVIHLNKTKGSRAAAAYKTAAGVAYSAVSAIRTVLSCNGAKDMIDRYEEATLAAYKSATGILVKIGLANGLMLGTAALIYFMLTLYGTSLIYRDVESTGCDPSQAISDNTPCASTGQEVLGAMFGVAFAARGISQVGNFLESFVEARVAVYDALRVINRTFGAPEVIIYKNHTKEKDDDILESTTHSKKSSQQISDDQQIIAILPKYEIDSSSGSGIKPTNIIGAISFKDVHFSYPTRPTQPILSGFSVQIQPGQTVAFVGPSGSGKSTVARLLERFYDPKVGSIELDGINLKDMNVSCLRSMIGYVGQEPTLFATTIRGNIKYGNPNATQAEIEEVARIANAHDFITSFPDGYDTQVGDQGSQLSGGQKQRIAICRCLIKSPKLLILDEATSALDSESELVVQEALDNILEKKKVTTVIIAHRLSTIRNADRIYVLVNGEIKEAGTHRELMDIDDGYYRDLVLNQDGDKDKPTNHYPSIQNSNTDNLATLEDLQNSIKHVEIKESEITHLEFKDVSFMYPTRPYKTVFSGFNLKIRKGQTVALCGPSGGGKSTVAALIERFYDPVSGSVEYLGNNIKVLNVDWYRDQIGYVGQEPTLFNDTIANNIAFGAKGVSQDDIIEAAKQANAYDFIMNFEQKFDTPVGEQGTQLSGGQKQRVAIARAIVRKPQILILDEATSALDNESESIVQIAVDKLMQSTSHTVIVIAHRLSTIRNADVIAFIANGEVLELGSHNVLSKRKNGRYKRLFESSKRDTALNASLLIDTKTSSYVNDDEEIDWEARVDEEEQQQRYDARRARQLAFPDIVFILLGAIGAVMAGGIYPLWGVLFSEMIALLYRPVYLCSDTYGEVPDNYASCQDYWGGVADSMREKSFKVGGLWVVFVIACILGNVLTFWGFGTACEGLSKRVRDLSFSALMRQEVAFYDKRSIGRITSQLQDDAARIHAFFGEPVRVMLVALASALTGITVSLIVMWPFALLAISCIPIMAFASSMRMKRQLGLDECDHNQEDGMNSPGGIFVETLLNIRTVASLTLERARDSDYETALLNAEPTYKMDALKDGFLAGSVFFIQFWINALLYWFGGWLLFNFQGEYEVRDFLIANFAIMFSMFGLGSAFQDVTDRKEVEKSAARIFHLLDRKSEIDPLSSEGEKLQTKENLDVACIEINEKTNA